MSDTAQAIPPADPFAVAAEAFKSFDAPPPEVARDEAGRFAPKQEAQAPDEIDPEAEDAQPEATDDSAEHEADAEAADEAQPDADVAMPASWPKDDSETWNALPPAARAIIAEREGQRDAAVNQKFQEAANVRKAAEAERQAANANREAYAAQLEQVLSLITPAAPDPSHYYDQDGNFDGNTYILHKAQYDQAQATVSELQKQRETISAQRAAEAQQALQSEWQQDGARLSAIPDFAPEKQAATFAAVEQYAMQAGVPAAALPMASPLEVELLWKAMQYDRQQSAKARVAPVAKPAPPNVRAGVSTPKAAVVNSQRQAAMQRLAKTGSIEDAAFFFKSQSKG